MNRNSVLKKVLFGALAALVLISLFVFSVREPNPEWGRGWMIKPLILTPLAGAFGGLFLSAPVLIPTRKASVRVLLVILGVAAFLFALWIGVVLGLDGTLWN